MKMRSIILLVTFLTAQVLVYGQSNSQTIVFDKTIHDFGQIGMKDGPVTCSFEFTNTGEHTIVISHVAASCGCTTSGWTQEPIPSGGRGFVKATYTPEGIIPFSKTLTVYFTGQPSSIALRITGQVMEKAPVVEELFPVTFGSLRAKSDQMPLAHIIQGKTKSDSLEIINGSTNPARLSFIDLPAPVKIEAPVSLAPSQRAFIRYTYDASEKSEWGAVKHDINVRVNGKKISPEAKFTLTATIEDDVAGMNRVIAPFLFIANHSHSFEKVKKGETKTYTYEIANNGRTNLTIHRAYADSEHLKVISPTSIKPGEKGKVTVVLNTKKETVGDKVYTITLVSNAPNQSLANLVLTGKLE